MVKRFRFFVLVAHLHVRVQTSDGLTKSRKPPPPAFDCTGILHRPSHTPKHMTAWPVCVEYANARASHSARSGCTSSLTKARPPLTMRAARAAMASASVLPATPFLTASSVMPYLRHATPRHATPRHATPRHATRGSGCRAARPRGHAVEPSGRCRGAAGKRRPRRVSGRRRGSGVWAP